MKMLAIQQPWAWAVSAGFKRVENRSWKTPYRGPVGIVSTAKRGEANECQREFNGELPADTFAFASIIGTAELVDVVPLSEAVEDDPNAFGPHCWLFARPKWFATPIPTTAKLRLYESTAAEHERITREVARPGRSVENPILMAFMRSIWAEPVDRVYQQALAYLRADRWPDVERAAARLVAEDANSPYAASLLAEVALNSERYRDALAHADRVIELDPEWAIGFHIRAEACHALGDTAAADLALARAVELDPSLTEDAPDDEGNADE